ncbi:short-chain dehydrogenase [Pseudidiomarina aquimaris]|uniref:Short-chain dehydrogenase n=1 Tax=Pseudidiomarina aquimaris TaxID=641841 RepID=A0A432XPL7_9GAMM|nr:SDR family NAD(P)-dependent oxidoreductase [Pseudidiomarina aquimaris]RUO50640.1 short-chain dehydrogenase [Pseudidiomarina aquimaris]
MKPAALITGAASGIGLDLARLLQHDYQLVLLDVNQEGLDACAKLFPSARCYQVDLASSEALAELTELLTAELPRLDVLINNAGVTHRSLARETSQQVIHKVMAVDYFAPVKLTQALMPLLEAENGGCIVTIGSMAGWMPVIERAGYCAAKSALHQYFEVLRVELATAASPVRVLQVYPSFLDTPIENHALDGSGGIAQHPRSMVGKMRSSQWMAERIVAALDTGRERLFPDKFTYFASLLYRLAPRLYQRLMQRKFAQS